jgi:molybdopterin/thiamine biosynthesis adenylyltransferase
MITDRYQRHSLIDWFSQEDVKSSAFAVIGCGAVGNEVSKNLALLGVGKIDLFDFDTIEIHNLTRSVLFREDDVGSYKAEVAGRRIQDLDPNIEVNVFVGDFWDLLTLEQAKKYDCILCCVDNFEARIRLNQICIITETNLINTGIDSKFSQIEIFPFRLNKHVACYECNLPNSSYERMQNRYSCGWLKKISYIEKKIPTTVVTSSLAGSLAVANAINLINSYSQNISRRILIDTFIGNSTVSTVEKSNTCPACGSMKEHVSIFKSSSNINSQISAFLDNEIYITTSDPILVSYRCIACNQEEDDATFVFKKASHFDSTITKCKICDQDTVQVTIKDSFSLKEIEAQFYGKKIPAKFIRFDTVDRTIIIELE